MTRINDFIVAIFLVLVNSASAEVLNKILFPAEVGEHYTVSCLDKSPAGYYLSEHPNSRGWVIYLEGGGLCVTRIDCEQRVREALGSSTHWEATHSDKVNVLSGTEDGNPFGEFNKVYVPYCTGDTWTGTTSSNPHLHGLATTGHNIITALLDHLQNTTSFGNATHILLSGGSAGGIGVFHNADYIGARLQKMGNTAVFKASPQGGFFFPRGVTLFEEFAVGVRLPFDIFAADYCHWLEGGYMNEACAAAHGTDKKAQCWDISIVQKYLTTPLFVAQNLLDSNQIADELGCLDICSADPKLKAAYNFELDYQNLSSQSLTQFVEDGSDRVVWAPSCYKHTDNLCMNIHNNPTRINGLHYSDALAAWFFNGTHSGEAHIVTCAPGSIACTSDCGHGCG